MNQNIYIQNGVWAIFSKIKTKLHYFHSMRMYLLLIFILVGILPLYFFSAILMESYKDRAVDNLFTSLQTQANMLGNMMQQTGYLSFASSAEVENEVSRVADLYQGKILVINGNLNIVKDTYGLETGKYLISNEVIQSFSGTTHRIHDEDNQHVQLTYPITDNQKNVVGVIIMHSSTKSIISTQESMEQRGALFMLAIGILIAVTSVYFSAKLTKPLIGVVTSINKITEGYLEEGIHIKGYYEIEKISDSFNQMIDRMQKLESSRQEFVSNVSHELKTPITSIKVLADSLLMQQDLPVELYREFLVDITDEIERENKIINDLLSLVKLDKTAGDLNISSININELLELILKRLRPIAKKRNIEMVFESFRPVVAEIDEVKLTLAISNLIENAIKYNVDDGWVRVSLNADHKYFYVKISDSGIGIPEDAQDFIFERFYRVDKARSRESGGTGLGLAITKNAIQMHRGAIKVYSKEGEGTTFNVRIPLNYSV